MQWKRLVQTTIGGGGSGNVGVKRQWYHGVGKAGNGGRRGATSSEAGQSDRYAIVNTQSHFVNTWAKHFDGKGQRINQEGAVIRAYRSINAFDTSRKIIILLTAWSASFRCGFGKKCAFTYDCHTTLSHTHKNIHCPCSKTPTSECRPNHLKCWAKCGPTISTTAYGCHHDCWVHVCGADAQVYLFFDALRTGSG